MRARAARRHEIGEDGNSGCRLEAGLQNERIRSIAARNTCRRRGSYDPATMLGRSEQRTEAGAGIETRPAQPIDRSVLADQGSRLAIADDAIVLDAQWHG